MPGARIREVVEQLDAARSRLLATVAALSDQDVGFSPSPDRWSIGEILHHLRLIQEGAIRVIQNRRQIETVKALRGGHP